MPAKKENNGCGCASIPFSLIIVLLGLGYWGFTHLDNLGISQILANNLDLNKFLPNNQQNNPQPTIPNLTPAPPLRVPVANSPIPQVIPTTKPTTNPQVSPLPITPKQSPSIQTAWEKK